MKYSRIEKYLMERPGITEDFKEEWRWTRYLLGDKVFAAVCRDDTGKEFLITMRLSPVEGDFLRQQYEDIIPGYCMNRKHWSSVRAGDSVPDEMLKDMLDKSYHLILSGFLKKEQKELLGGTQMGR